MSPFQLIVENLRHHRRIHAAVALGVLAATAVLTGALLVGDSMRGSLRHLTLDRLGRIDEVLVTPRFFRAELATETAAQPDFAQHFSTVVPAIFVQATLETADKPIARAGGVNVLGCDAEFWKLGEGGPKSAPKLGEIVLNQPLADALGITAEMIKGGGHKSEQHKPVEILLRIGQASEIPADSPLGRKTETVRSRRVRVSDIIPASGLGRFGLRPNQQLPRNAYVATETLQAMLDQRGRVNALLVAGKSAGAEPTAADHDALAKMFQPKLADYGISIQLTKRGYFNVTSDRMLLEPAVEAAAIKAYSPNITQPAFTYLANYIEAGPDAKGQIPYSTVTGVDFAAAPPLGPFKTPDGATIDPLADDEIVLNSWAADDLKAQGVEIKPGDEIKLVYFEPESTHGQVREKIATFQLKAVVTLSGGADDPDWTPELKGVTDEESIKNWNPPFPYYPERVRSTPPNDQDDRYWKQHKATPKAFLSLAAARKLWASRFGRTTSIRIPPGDELTQQRMQDKLQLAPAAFGFEFLPVKRWGLMAASGTTPFGLLFLGFSFFIIAAALMLIMLLFRLGIEQRAKEIGLLAALGWPAKKIRRLLLVEGLIVAAIGAAIGIEAGVGYAWLMITGLKTWWVGAVTTPFLDLYISPVSLLIGYSVGLAVALLTIVFALRRLRRASVRQLLAGQIASNEGTRVGGSLGKKSHWIAAGLCVAAVGLGVFGGRLSGEAQAGAFFGAGFLVLAAALLEVFAQLRGGGKRSLIAVRGRSGATAGSSSSVTGTVGRANDGTPVWLPDATLVRLAIRNGGRNPGRSTLTIGLVAAASFLIVAISAFRLDPPAAGPVKDSGNGGFALIGQSDQPVFHGINTPDGQEKLSVSPEQADRLQGVKVFPLRVQSGDDASCLNLFQPRQPRMLGLSEDFITRGGFAFSESAATTPDEKKNPWLLLNKAIDGAVPVILDENTALYSLHLGDFMHSPIGMSYEIDNGRGGKLKLQVVGLLKDSIFQGDLLVSETDLVKNFPDVSGYRAFLVEIDPLAFNTNARNEFIITNQRQPPSNFPKEFANLIIPSHPRESDPLQCEGEPTRLEDRLISVWKKMLRNSPTVAAAWLEFRTRHVNLTLTDVLGDYGYVGEQTEAKLAEFMVVQNTYLSTFQSLGGLGLLLGTLGLATVQLRNVFERRRELALLRAIGFRRQKLAAMVMLENASLLVAGLAAGVFAALVAVWPHLFGGGVSLPWRSLIGTLAVVLVVGLLAGLAAVRATLRAPLLPALREE